MENNSKLSEKKFFLDVVNVFARGVYILSLILVVGGLLFNFLYPNIKGAGYPFFYEIAPFLLCSASILVILHLWKRRHSAPNPDSCGWRIFVLLVKPILWVLSVSILFTIILEVHEFITNPRLPYPEPYDPQKFAIFLWKAVPVFFGSVILLLLLYMREKKLKQRQHDS